MNQNSYDIKEDSLCLQMQVQRLLQMSITLAITIVKNIVNFIEEGRHNDFESTVSSQ